VRSVVARQPTFRSSSKCFSETLTAEVEKRLLRFAGSFYFVLLDNVVVLFGDETEQTGVWRWRLFAGFKVDQEAVLEGSRQLEQSLQVDGRGFVEKGGRGTEPSQSRPAPIQRLFRSTCLNDDLEGALVIRTPRLVEVEAAQVEPGGRRLVGPGR
jgi:hypothetical protein